jgi:hypothetical protein
MAALEKEEEEEVGRSRDHTVKKGVHTDHPSMISCPWSFGGVVHNPPRVAYILRWDESCVVDFVFWKASCQVWPQVSQSLSWTLGNDRKELFWNDD